MSQSLRQEFEAIQERWRARCRDGRLPSRSDFPPESLTTWMGHIQIVELVREAETIRYRVRLVGTRIVYYEGRDNTGRFLDDVIPTRNATRYWSRTGGPRKRADRSTASSMAAPIRLSPRSWSG